MPRLGWVMVIAAVLGLLIGFLIKSGLLAPTGQESAVRPGKPVEGYHEQVTSTYLRAKQQIGDIRKKQDEQTSW